MREDVPPLIRVAWHAGHEFGGDEICTVQRTATGWRLSGDVVTERDGHGLRIRYAIEADAGWHTRAASVRIDEDAANHPARHISLASDGLGHWTLDGVPFPDASAAVDVDLGWTPATNTLPIRRLGLEPGESSNVRVVWVRFPELDVVVADQEYERLATDRYRYASGDFVADLIVDDHGLVTQYESLWRRVPVTSVVRDASGLA